LTSRLRTKEEIYRRLR
jgi:calmodulin